MTGGALVVLCLYSFLLSLLESRIFRVIENTIITKTLSLIKIGRYIVVSHTLFGPDRQTGPNICLISRCDLTVNFKRFNILTELNFTFSLRVDAPVVQYSEIRHKN